MEALSPRNPSEHSQNQKGRIIHGCHINVYVNNQKVLRRKSETCKEISFIKFKYIYICTIDVCLGIDVTVCVCFRLEWDLKDFEEDLDKALDHFRGLVIILN